MINRLRLFKELWVNLGPRWLAFRIWYSVSLRLGIVQRRTPHVAWNDQTDDFFRHDFDAVSADYLLYRQRGAPRFFFQPANRKQYRQQLMEFDSAGHDPVSIAEEVIEGKLRYFADLTVEVGYPPEWHTNPFTGDQIPPINHWSKIDDFENGDIKVIWEPSRFGFAYALVRAFWRTDDDRYAETFWQLVEDWREKNPPQLGPNWRCGQETSFRVMAWCFGMYGFIDSSATSTERVRKLAQMVAVSGQRIEANLSYALSQRNNHGISEGMGLWTIGALFPEFRKAEHWRHLGRQILEDQGRDLIYEDGSFSQHSSNYQRLMMHDYLWCLRLGDLHHDKFSTELQSRLEKAAEFIYQIQIGSEGQLPNFGPNDGSLILPLNNCAFEDYRPVIQSTGLLCKGRKYYGHGPWDEDLLWLFGPEALNAEKLRQTQSGIRAEVGGYYSIREGSSFSLIRLPNFQHRPSHADALNFDLWWKNQNITIDAGTYSYNEPKPWNNPLGSTCYHNAITVDGHDQMDRVGRFLWLPWLKSNVQNHTYSTERRFVYLQGEHDGFHRLDSHVNHQRGILYICNDQWLILDRLSGSVEHDYRLQWLFSDWPYDWDRDHGRLSINTNNGDYNILIGEISDKLQTTLVRADESTPRGWRSNSYLHKQPALSLAAQARSQFSFFYTFFSPESSTINISQKDITIDNDISNIVIQISNLSADLIIQRALGTWSGISESLDLPQ